MHGTAPCAVSVKQANSRTLPPNVRRIIHEQVRRSHPGCWCGNSFLELEVKCITSMYGPGTGEVFMGMGHPHRKLVHTCDTTKSSLFLLDLVR